MSKTLLKHIAAEQEAHKARLEQRARAIAASLDGLYALQDADGLTYEVAIDSLWDSDWEKPVKLTRTGPVRKAVRAAVAEFRALNNRTDDKLQAKVVVHAVLAPGLLVPVPERFWKAETAAPVRAA